ncbi:hypothetical protein JTB14_015873 [Gonioctena quinquepunctata]|nr:hypothetical protein JTB14_015873 [Gonioctena quinquepunctata]
MCLWPGASKDKIHSPELFREENLLDKKTNYLRRSHHFRRHYQEIPNPLRARGSAASGKDLMVDVRNSGSVRYSQDIETIIVSAVT